MYVLEGGKGSKGGQMSSSDLLDAFFKRESIICKMFVQHAKSLFSHDDLPFTIIESLSLVAF